jgi:hypothetical protein
LNGSLLAFLVFVLNISITTVMPVSRTRVSGAEEFCIGVSDVPQYGLAQAKYQFDTPRSKSIHPISKKC